MFALHTAGRGGLNPAFRLQILSAGVFFVFFFKGDCVTSAISRQIRAAVTAGPQRWRALKETGAAVGVKSRKNENVYEL